MKEKRLIEITSEICKLDGPLAVLKYLTSLCESEVYLFLRYIGTASYGELNIYDAAMSFSRKYLESKKILVEAPSFEQYECRVSNLGQIMAMDNSYRESEVGRRR